MRIIDAVIRRAARSQTTLPLKERLGRKLRETYYNAEVLYRIQDKTAPLNMQLDAAAPARVNLLIPEINFNSFYGGYMAKFNLAGKLVERGYRVRLVVVDPGVYDPGAWRRALHDYPGLEAIFDRVEVAYQGDRRELLAVSGADRFIATTWWTAYLADDAARRTQGPPFVYLIQEYEPFTFPLGSYYAMAGHSYTFDHRALFSSGLLRDYFESEGLGVFDGRGGGAAAAFENAIVEYQEAELDQALDQAGGRPKRLLFYARPEAHATRNMFEIGFLALSRAIERGMFDGDWAFHGIGSGHGDIALPHGHVLQMLGKLSLSDYRQALLGYDVGLSLMYTPHPSLLPLDMASAGMIVVTNICLNKTEPRLAALSANLLGAEPHIEGVCARLGQAVARARDPARRRAGARVQWASSWDETFNDALMDRLAGWLA